MSILSDLWKQYRAVESEALTYEDEDGEEYLTERGEVAEKIRAEIARLTYKSVLWPLAMSKRTREHGTRNMGRHGRSKRKSEALEEGSIKTDAWGRSLGVRYKGEIVTHGRCMVKLADVLLDNPRCRGSISWL